MADYKIFSADSHVSEPGDLWVNRIDKEFQFRAPRLEQRERNGRIEDLWIYEGFPPHPVGIGLGAAAADNHHTYREQGKGYADARPGGWDPAARIADQDLDGVDGEVLYTTLGFRLFWMSDPKLQEACFRVYNDWLAEFCSYDPSRYVGLSLISLFDIDNAIKEMERSAKMGHRGVMIFLSPPSPCPPYTSRAYDKFWAAAVDLDQAVVLHENTGGAESRLSPSSYWNPDYTLGTVLRPHEVQRTMAQLILSGVCERFPSIRFVSAENGTDWLPVYLKRLAKPVRGGGAYETKLNLTPMEYFHRNMFITYIDEPEAIAALPLIGEDNLLFSTDYPHTAATWPKSQEIVSRDTDDLSDDTKRKLVRDNTLKVFGIKSPVLA